ncbi:MSMEG_0569 family flavin-dependent oxidoreductase [Shimia sp. R11_0]|uniref:MSMEG_0569 family flavin-dependent oxidoreductase n=1 Tax=Shimia sp. R11_0 TaxID=2821096 RepID=UPI001AD95308|nr:MSMEG_0569 family flavin-dependent oxidoreductase [Shimia sp. R11_0]MBO9477918.1 MSMEG_0569 family flavin-dependent oxidoreductase [Shimia sp. R11_0]
MTHRNHKTVVVVGGGQAGLSVSYYLCQQGLDHVVLERHKRFHSWRVNRWDSFCLVTPNWQCRLPDFPYQGQDPDGFMVKEEITDYLDAFAERFSPPLVENCDVTRISKRPGGGYLVDSSQGNYSADQIVIATGGYDNPIVPPFASNLDPSIHQMHSVDYRRPDQMPDGATLVVGTGQSGVQLMEDMHLEGRKVHLAVGPAPRAPRQYRGRDSTDWLFDMGYYEITIDQHPNPEHAVTKTNHYMTGRDGGHEIDLRKFALEGVSLYGSVSGMTDKTIQFLPDLEANLDDADDSYMGIRAAIDAYIAKHNIEAPEEPAFTKFWRPEREITEIDCEKEGITSILWAIGFRPDYSWIDVDVFDAQGRPVYQRGVCEETGFYFIGLGWLNTWGSGRFLGIDEDARHLATHIAATAKSSLQAAS